MSAAWVCSTSGAVRRAALIAQLPLMALAVETDTTIDPTVATDTVEGNTTHVNTCIEARYKWETNLPLLGDMCAGEVLALCAAVVILLVFVSIYTYCRVFGWDSGKWAKVRRSRQPATPTAHSRLCVTLTCRSFRCFFLLASHAGQGYLRRCR